LNATIMQLQTWLTGNITAYNSLQSTYTNYVNDHLFTNEQYASIVNLDDSEVAIDNETISQPANSYTDMSIFAAYSGYVSVNVTSSTTNTTYVEVIYSSHGITYDNTITVGTNGTADFPVLTNVQITFPPIGSIAISPFLINNTAVNTGVIFILFNSTAVIGLMLSASQVFATLLSPALVFRNTEIRVGNTNSVGNATETVTITYYY